MLTVSYSNPDIRSARLYGQFSLDKTLTLQAGSTVSPFLVSFVASVLTTVVLVTKFVNQPAAHGSFAYSDTLASGLMSAGLLLDGILYMGDSGGAAGGKSGAGYRGCTQYKVIYGLFIVPVITR